MGQANPFITNVMSVERFSEISRNIKADEYWDNGPDNANHECNLIDQRANDSYPQNRQYIKCFLEYCLVNRRAYRVKVLKKSPYWEWYFEIL